MIKKIGDMKTKIKTQELCHGCPNEFVFYMEYCKDLEFDQKPDYSFMRDLMQNVANRERLDLTINCFDWCLLFHKSYYKSSSNYAQYYGPRSVDRAS